jgi:NADH-quinone oxidoreductase subunit F
VTEPRLLPPTPIRSLAEYEDRFDGGAGLARARAIGADAVVAELTASGLRGRGGAGFPAGRKWGSIRAGGPEVGDRYVAVNGAEGEPGTYKDRALMVRNPYQVLEGLQIAAETVGAVHAFVALKARYRVQVDALERAAREMTEHGLLGSVPVTIVTGPDDYLFGEETGLLEVIEGSDPLPRAVPPYVTGLFATTPALGWSAGPVGVEDTPAVDSNPTLVSNVETFAYVAPIVARGAAWFRSVGTERSPGTAIATVVGDVERPGLAEVALGTPVAEVIRTVGGGVRGGRAVKAVLSGVANPVLTAAHLDTPMAYETLSAVGSGMGSCGFMVFAEPTDVVALAQAVSRFLYEASCGQCPACKFGTGEVTAYLDRIAAGIGDERDIELIGARLATVTDANRCYLGAQEQRVISSLLRAFPEDFVVHLERAPSTAPLGLPTLPDEVVTGG